MEKGEHDEQVASTPDDDSTVSLGSAFADTMTPLMVPMVTSMMGVMMGGWTRRRWQGDQGESLKKSVSTSMMSSCRGWFMKSRHR